MSVKIDGQAKLPGAAGSRDNEQGQRVQRVQVDQRLDSPDFFSVQLQMADGHDNDVLDKLKPGAGVEILIGYGTEGAIFKGEISYIEPHFAPGERFVTIAGYDYSHRLTRGTNSRTFGDGHKQQQNPGTILGTVVSDSKALKGDKSDGLSASTKTADSKLEYIAQYNMNDYQFIQQVIGSFGMGWDAKSHSSGKQLSLKAPETSGAEVLKICRDKFKAGTEAQAMSADFRLSTVRQVARVEVRGWDGIQKQPILGKSEKISSALGGTPGIEQAGKAHYGAASAGRVLSIVDIPVGSKGEADEIAQSIMDKLAMDWMTADVVIEGRPELHAGVIVNLSDFGTRYSGKYLVEGCQHVYIAGSGSPYRTFLKLARNASPEP
ncbi:MAG: contractile injection system protein, VgrG/Pvc8 family [Myxococcota bacterium]